MAKSSQIGLHAWLPQAICLVIRFVVNGLWTLTIILTVFKSKQSV
jgi:hypothetical protein